MRVGVKAAFLTQLFTAFSLYPIRYHTLVGRPMRRVFLCARPWSESGSIIVRKSHVKRSETPKTSPLLYVFMTDSPTFILESLNSILSSAMACNKGSCSARKTKYFVYGRAKYGAEFFHKGSGTSLDWV